jgi:CheY-like chemotaxis protein
VKGQRDMAKILIAEDERDIRDLIKFTLTYAGHEVTPVVNGEEATRTAVDLQPDLIMLDLRMPRMNGFEACRALKADPRTASIPVVFLSAKGMDEEQEAGKQAGAIGFITKPFAPDELSRRVGDILKQAGANES